jgi:hypothetical protein
MERSRARASWPLANASVCKRLRCSLVRAGQANSWRFLRVINSNMIPLPAWIRRGAVWAGGEQMIVICSLLHTVLLLHACAGPESPYGGEEHRTGPDKRRRPAGEILSLGWPGGQGKRRLTVVVVWSPTPTTGTHLAACS